MFEVRLLEALENIFYKEEEWPNKNWSRPSLQTDNHTLLKVGQRWSRVICCLCYKVLLVAV
jgi:hypothetical protein